MPAKTKEHFGIIKRNPMISGFIGLIALSSSIVGSVILIEDRYAHNSDLTALKADVIKDKKETFKSFAALIKMQYEDAIMDLDIKVQSGTATPYEIAKLSHLKRRLQQLGNI